MQNFTITIIHPVALLAEPRLGSPVVALLAGSETLSGRGPVAGFWQIQHAGHTGFVPAAACLPQAASALSPTRVKIRTPLYRTPALDNPFVHNPDQWFLVPAEPLLVLSERGAHLLVQRVDGQRGYIPRAVCVMPQRVQGHRVTRVAQQLALHRVSNAEGERMWVLPEEALLLLGQDGAFILAQRDDGRIGYVVASQQGQAQRDTLVPIGPVDAGWTAVGCVWALVNWGGVLLVVTQIALLVSGVEGYVGLITVFALAALLWFGSPRRYVARSFAAGILLAYALLHLLTAGYATGWR